MGAAAAGAGRGRRRLGAVRRRRPPDRRPGLAVGAPTVRRRPGDLRLLRRRRRALRRGAGRDRRCPGRPGCVRPSRRGRRRRSTPPSARPGCASRWCRWRPTSSTSSRSGSRRPMGRLEVDGGRGRRRRAGPPSWWWSTGRCGRCTACRARSATSSTTRPATARPSCGPSLARLAAGRAHAGVPRGRALRPVLVVRPPAGRRRRLPAGRRRPLRGRGARTRSSRSSPGPTG